MESRILGKTGERLSIIGLGGIVVAGMEPRDAERVVDEALGAGITYVDVAPTYGDAEEKLGPALYGKRDKVFLACKTTERTKDGSRRELERSLERLRTDHVDVYQLHGVTKLEDVATIFGPNGAMETFLRAREEGKTRYLGFSAHSEAAALALLDGFAFDTILFPVNWVCWYTGEFGPRVIARAKEQGMGLLALKAMAKQKWNGNADRSRYPKCWYEPVADEAAAARALRFTLTQGITACVPPGDPEIFRLAVRVASNGGLPPLSEDEQASLRREAQALAPIFPQG